MSGKRTEMVSTLYNLQTKQIFVQAADADRTWQLFGGTHWLPRTNQG